MIENLSKVDYILFELTNYCNLRCSFCNREDLMGPDKRYTLKHMGEATWSTMLDNISDLPLKEAKFTGLGEPYLHKKIDVLLKMFKEKFSSCHTIVATNCQYKINDTFRESLKYIDTLYLSIDGYKESYERDRAPARWKRLIKFLEDLKTVNRHSCNIVVNYVVNTENVKDISKIDKLINQYDIDELRLNIAQDWTETSSLKNIEETWGYKKEDLDYLRDNYQDKIKGKSPWTWSDCFWPKRGMYVNVTGDVLMCALNTSTEPFGNLLYESVDDIRSSEKWQSIARGCETDCPVSHCKNCSYRELSPLLGKLGAGN